MNKEEIFELICELAKSQGFYCRLRDAIIEGGEEGEMYLQELEEQNFTDVVSLILYIEC